MASVVRMPSVLAGATEAAIASWLVAPGDAVSVGDPLAEIETEKAIVEYSAEEAGVVGRLVLAAGAAGEIGAPIAVLVKDGETDADIDAALGGEAPAASAAAPAAAAPAGPPAVSAPDPAAPSAPDAVSPSAPTGPVAPAARRPYESEPAAQAAPAAPAVRIFASPIVRKIAREQGIDLAAIAGTGPNGRIVRRDLERLAAGHRPAAGDGARRRPGRTAAGCAPAGCSPGRVPARPGPGVRRRHADPAHAYPPRHRAPPHREHRRRRRTST